MREFAKTFYRSAGWRRARDAFISERLAIDGGLCELCRRAPGTEVHHKTFLTPENIDDKRISLNPENFQLLCFDCHHIKHEAVIREAREAEKKRNGKDRKLSAGGYYFDENGNVIPFRVILVCGAPWSDKLSYIRENMEDGDVVIDVDRISQALGMTTDKDVSRNVERIAQDVRDFLYKRIENKEINARAVWISAELPKREDRDQIRTKLRASVISVHSDFKESYQRMLSDEDQRDKASGLARIERWFREFEPDLPPISEKIDPPA